MIRKLLMASILLVLALSVSAMAAITEQEAAQLGGQTLTPFGAEKAGSKDGSIPAWTGGITKGPDGWYYEGKLKVPFSKLDPNTKIGIRPDPFADDKMLYTINAQNMAQYADKLSEGFKAVMAKYPEVKMNVYPSRRSMSYSQAVIDGTKKCAVKAHLTDDGRRMQDAHMGIPFPMPKSGSEALWNHMVRWSGTLETYHYRAYLVNSAGRLISTAEGFGTCQYAYWDPDSKDTYRMMMVFDNNIGPPNRVGEGTMFYLVNDYRQPMPVWSYLPGQRRVKLAPQLTFDTPNTGTAGASTSDDTYMFTGSPERFDWKLLGKKQMIVPYNMYKAMYWTKDKDLMQPNFINSDAMRYEMHRVWILEATLKTGARHVYKKRVYYIDEDSWQILMSDLYDNNNKLYRMGWMPVVFNYDIQAPMEWCGFTKDLITGIWCAQGLSAETGGTVYKKNLADDQWTPSVMAGRGVR